MTRDIIELNNFIIFIEESRSKTIVADSCRFNEQTIGFAFYGSGDGTVTINYNDEQRVFQNSKGLAMSFCVNKEAEFIHTISNKKPLECVVIAITTNNINKLPSQEKELFRVHLNLLLKSKKSYTEGPNFFMHNEMQTVVDKILKVNYKGAARTLFLRSQVMELLSHFFVLVAESNVNKTNIKSYDRSKLYEAQEIINNNIAHPPSITELAKLTGLNNTKLKKNFKELFGLPVYKYLQKQRLKKAHELLSHTENGIQEVARSVGYESVSSFSNAFVKQFGFRPSQTRN